MKRKLLFFILILIGYTFHLEASQFLADCYQENLAKATSLHIGGNYSEAGKFFSVAQNCKDRSSGEELNRWQEKNEECLIIFNESMKALSEAKELEAKSNNTYSDRRKFTIKYRIAHKKLKKLKALNPHHSNIDSLIEEAHEKLSQSEAGNWAASSAVVIIGGIIVLIVVGMVALIKRVDFF